MLLSIDFTNQFIITIGALLIGIIPLFLIEDKTKQRNCIVVASIAAISVVYFQMRESHKVQGEYNKLETKVSNAKKNTDSLKVDTKTIIDLNIAASKGLDKIKEIDSTILGLNQETSSLVSDIEKAQTKLNRLSEQANALGVANVTMNDYIIGMTTGGNSYLKASLTYSNNKVSIIILSVGKYPMRSVLIAINDDGVKDYLRDKPVSDFIMDSTKLTSTRERRYFQVKYDKVDHHHYTNPGLPFLANFDADDYDEDLDFKVLVESENGETLQWIHWPNFRNSDKRTSILSRFDKVLGRYVFIDSLP